jgi:hypothetical protein
MNNTRMLERMSSLELQIEVLKADIMSIKYSNHVKEFTNLPKEDFWKRFKREHNLTDEQIEEAKITDRCYKKLISQLRTEGVDIAIHKYPGYIEKYTKIKNAIDIIEEHIHEL